tara:strand:+ start:225 stop:491 length:267 start_codon:yes stop_codon:yes gene_type:complete
MLASPKSRKVLDTILSAALDDDHKHQAAAWKIVVDRILPVGMFEKDVMGTGGRPSVNITITGVGGMGVVQEEEQAVDVESFEYSGVDE